MSTYKQSEKIGKEGERLVQQLLEGCGYTCQSVDKGEKNDYDIKVTKGKKSFTIEVKYDKYSEVSQNLYVEIFNSKLNKPSGVYSSKSDFFVYCLPDGPNRTLWLIKTIRLRDFVKTETPLKVFSQAGDQNSTGMIFKLSHILPSFTRLDNISCEEVGQVIKKLLKDKT